MTTDAAAARPGRVAVSRKGAYAAVLATAMAAFGFSALASLWVAPQGLGLGTPGAYAAFHDGSLVGIWFFSAIWALWSCLCVLVRLRWSDAWVRRGRHRYISFAGSVLMTAGLIGTASWMPYLQVDLAMHNVIPYQARDGSSWTGFQLLRGTAACAILAAFVLRAVGAVIDRAIGKAPILVVG